MKRRTFLTRTSLAGATGAAAVTAETDMVSAQSSRGTTAAARNPGRVFRLTGEYYRHYPVDFSLGKESARGFRGWGEKIPIEAPADETALVLMHV